MDFNGNTIVTGIVRGKTIELQRDLGLPDGHQVTISIRSTSSASPPEGIRLSAGAWASDDDDFDRYLEWSRNSRKRSRPDFA